MTRERNIAASQRVRIVRIVRGIAALLTVVVLTAHAQVIRDGSIGPSATVQPAGPAFVIDESMGRLVGSNLFHSFARFDLDATQSATFTAVSPVGNALARVTGGASRIDGELASTIAGANLFLINPAGIVFGANAAVDVEGAFHVSTADFVGFDSGERFEVAVGGSVPALASAAPAAFGFLGAAARISIQGAEIELEDGQTLSLVAGGVDVDAASIGVAGGEIRIVAADSAGEVALAGAPRLDGFTRLGDVRIGAGAELDVGGDPAGTVLIRGADLRVNEAEIGAATEGATARAGAAVDIEIRGTLAMSGQSEISASTEDDGRGGDIRLAAARISLAEDSEVVSDTEGAGDAGRVILEADEVVLSGDSEIASDVETGASGRGGEVSITTRTLTLLDAPEISTDTDPDSTGAGGRIDIRASESVELRIQTVPGEQAGIFSNSEGAGDAGDVSVTTPRLDIDGGVITAQTEGPGRGGDVQVRADRVRVIRAGEISARSAGSGDAGNIVIDGNDSFSVLDGGRITAESAVSDGGNIVVSLGTFDLVLLRRGTVSANVNNGTGGNITLRANTVIVDNAAIVAQAGAGRGGAIRIEAGAFFSDGALISASAGPAGISGSVDIDAPDIDLSGNLQALTTDYLDAAAILARACAARRAGTRASSLTLAPPASVASGIEGLPLAGASGPAVAALRLLPAARAMRDRSAAARERPPVRARAALEDVLRDALELPAVAGTVYVLNHIAQGFHALAEVEPDSDSAALLGAHRALTRALSLARSIGDARALSFAAGNMARLYALERRYREAVQLAREAQTAAVAAHAPEAEYRWRWLAGKWLWAQGRTDAALAELERAVAVLDVTRPGIGDHGAAAAYFDRTVSPVYRDLVAALLDSADLAAGEAARDALLVQALEVLERFRAAELRDYFEDECVAQVSAENAARGVRDANVAVLHPVVLPARTELLVSVGGRVMRHRVAVRAGQLAAQTRSLRRALEDPDSGDYLRPARRLYDWLIRPIAAELASAGIDTLVMVPDGPLRAVPLGVLHDGERHLVEHYAIAVAPGLSLVDLRPIGQVRMRALAGGLTGAIGGFAALPQVESEVRGIAESLGGEVLLDADFSLERLRSTLLARKPNVVHIASHARFEGSLAASFILTHDARLDVDSLERIVAAGRTDETPLELLVLSACETATGDDRAALGLAGIAVRAGARSALGSLWNIADDAAATLMQSFYRNLSAPGASRAGALRAAQLELLADARYAHPFFWSPYLLINNWR